MITKKYQFLLRKMIKRIQIFSHRIWFPPLLSLLAFSDTFVIVIPTDGILISSSMLNKRRWLPFALSVAIGSSFGALALVYLVDHYGLQKIIAHFPFIGQSHFWHWTLNLFTSYGLIIVFLIGITPLSQQPVLFIAAMSNLPMPPLILAIFISRLIKFNIMAYIASHVPRLLNKLWGIKGEVEKVGLKINP